MIVKKKLEVKFINEGFQLSSIKSFSKFYPFNLMLGLLNYKSLSISERIKLLKLFIKLPFQLSDSIGQLNVEQWLQTEGQSQNALNSFWKILAVGALNTNVEKASAKIFIDILKQIFFSGNKSATIILPKFGLSESYCTKAGEYIVKNGVELKTSETVEKIIVSEDKVVKLQTSKNIYSDFDIVISAIPAFALSRIIGENINLNLPDFKYSSILNIHLWLKENKFPEGFYGLINSPLHWVFNKGSHLNIVISDADEIVNKSDDELIAMAKNEMKKYFLLDPELISASKIIKEKRATFIPSKDVINDRPAQKTSIKNLILAGDWVDTGLPSTIESAVKSGKVVTELVMMMN